MVTNDTLMNFGFIKDENNLKLKELLKKNVELKELHIDVYPDNPLEATQSPFMLLLRMIEKNVMVESDDNRVILKKHDRYETCLSNVLFSKIKECFFKISDVCSEFVVNIQNIYYRIIVFK